MNKDRESYVAEIDSLLPKINEAYFLYQICVILRRHIMKMDVRLRSEGGADA